MSDKVVFDIEDLPDALSQAEAVWMLSCLAHAAALREAYRVILEDRKAWADWDRVCVTVERGIRRIYPDGEALYLIRLAEQKGRQGCEAQKARMEEAERVKNEPQNVSDQGTHS